MMQVLRGLREGSIPGSDKASADSLAHIGS